jgi:hypothetical protein
MSDAADLIAETAAAGTELGNTGTRIRLHEHPFSGAPAREFWAPSIAHWMVEHYGLAPQVRAQVFRGEPSAETELLGADAVLASDAPLHTVLQSPGYEAIVVAVQWVWANLAYIAAAYQVASALLASPPGMPPNVNRSSSSPNNSLGARDNQVRMNQRVEDIVGRVVSVPSLLMPTYTKYVDNKQVEVGYYSATRGYLEIDPAGDTLRIRDGDSLVADIPGTSVAVYEPFTSPNSGDTPQHLIGDAIIDPIVTVKRSTQVNGFTLKAPNQVQLVSPDDYTLTPDAGGDIITQSNTAPNFNAVAAAGDMLTIALSPVVYTVAAGGGLAIELTIDATAKTIHTNGTDWPDLGLEVGAEVTLAGWSIGGNNGTFEVVSFPSPGLVEIDATTLVDEFVTGVASVAWSRDYSGTREIASVADGYVVLTDSIWTFAFEGSVAITLADKSEWTAWVTLTVPDRTEAWLNIIALAGLNRDDGGGPATTSVDYEIEIEQLDADDLSPLGVVETVTGTLSGDDSEEYADTVERATGWTGPCRVRARRSSNYDYGFNGRITDEIKWQDLYAVSPVDKLHFGNKTTFHTLTYATPRATSSRTRQLSVLGCRMFPTWNGTAFSGSFDAEGRHVSGTIHATTRMLDIVPALAIDPFIGRRSIDEVDMVQLGEVQAALDALHAEAGQFSYTFDTANFSFEETLATIANAVFCKAYRQGTGLGKIRFALDRKQLTSGALFTHRNKRPQSIEPERLSRSFANDADHDGVEFTYVDPDTEQPEMIRIPLDGSAANPKAFEIPGIRSFAQAWLRAWREYFKLKGQRLAIETAGTTDARLLLPFARVDIVDNTRYRSFDGEVVGQDGLTLTLSQAVEFAPGDPHSIVLMRRDGSLQGITCTAGADDHHVVLAELPSEAIVTEHGPAGVRTIYSFASDADRDRMAYLIDEIDPPKSNYVVMRAVNYSDDYYAMDTETIPAAATVIY